MWLASYPKSGNTWMRAFVSALIDNGKVDLNNLKSDGIFSSRAIFERITNIDSRDLYDDEAKAMMADVYTRFALNRDELSIIKVHDAYENDSYNKPIIPVHVTYCAIYIIRNPLDIAGSLSSHMKISLDDAVSMLNNPDACIACQPNNLNKNNQFRQHLSDWSGHVKSWTENAPLPVHIIRYEDMVDSPNSIFTKLLNEIGWQFTDELIDKAITATNFQELRKLEESRGFAEMDVPGRRFFRAGKTGNWKNELNSRQIEAITDKHNALMKQYGYLP